MNNEENPDVVSVLSAAISLDSKLSLLSTINKGAKSDDYPVSYLNVSTDV